MLLFIDMITNYCIDAGIFQNISCYCLSKIIEREFSGKNNFKTSHVIVYQYQGDSGNAINVFQNISCYCLSFWCNACVLYNFIFQNISCYCLSCCTKGCSTQFFISKHLMLLFIPFHVLVYTFLMQFQNISCYCLSN